MTLSNRLRAIADLLDLLAPAGLAERVNPIDDNASLEIAKNAYDFCLKFSEGRRLLQILEANGVGISVYDDEGNYIHRNELDPLIEA